MKNWRKLVDCHIGAARLAKALETWLDAHSVAYRRHDLSEGGWRYWVKQNDLNYAQSVLPAIQQLGERG